MTSAVAHAADCPQPTNTQSLAAATAAADAAFAAMDLVAFERAHGRAVAQLDCLGDPLNPADAAGYHRLEALKAFVDQNHEGAVQSFQSAVVILPNYTLPRSVAPEGHPLWEAFEEARERPAGRSTELQPPKEAVLLIDGSRTLTRPMGRPVTLQLLSETGQVVWTEYLPTGAMPPTWDVAPARTWEPSAMTRNRRVTLVAVAGATALTAGVLYVAAASSRGTFNNPDTAYEDLDRLKRRTNSLTITSAGAAALGVGLGVYAVVKW